MSNKKVQVANFNVVFLEKEEEAPLLKYFDSIVFPALRSGVKKTVADTKYLFTDIEVTEDEEKGYVLTGNIVKQTIIEIKSDLDENEKLIEMDEKYSSAPFSAFAIFLCNHRMIFIQNQKGSPTIKNFASLIRYTFVEYIKKYNAKQDQKENYLPFPFISIVGLPLKSNIKEALRDVAKINKVVLRFYPLNGDQEFEELYDSLISDMRKKVGSKKGEIVLKSPQSISGVIDLIEKSSGTIEPIIEVTYPDKTKGRITEEMVAERMEMSFLGDNLQEIDEIIEKGKTIQNLNFVSEKNKEIYDKNKSKIIKFISR